MGCRSILCFALLASCAGNPPRPAELRASLPVQYRASLASRGLADDEPNSGSPASDRAVRLEVSVLRCSAAEASARLGELAPGPAAWIASAAEAARLTSGGDVVFSPRLVVLDGQRSRFALLDEQAYVARFELEGDGRTVVADPVVETLQHGTRFDTRASLTADGSIELELVWNTCEPDGDLPEISRPLPLGETSVVVQVPLVLTQEVSTRATLGRDQCLVVTCPEGEGRQRIAVVTAEQVEPEVDR